MKGINRWLMVAFLPGILSVVSCIRKTAVYYSADDFLKVPKIDVHFHYNTRDTRYLDFADSLNFRLVSPNVDAGRLVEEQLGICRVLKEEYPEIFAFFGSFSLDGFGTEGFAERTISRIDECMKAGASGIKIWKNIGMVLQDAEGNYVMADDPVFEPVFAYLQENRIPLMAHLGEPLNCWLPLEEMTLDNDRRYFAGHPQYHMYLHPEAPSYEDQINARDNLLKRYPLLDFTGAHLASLEWDVDKLAERFDSFPHLRVDMSARIGHLQYQSLSEREKVRNFMIKYQDRIMYATDRSVSDRSGNFHATTENLFLTWKEDWIFLATDGVVQVNDLGGQEVKGLQLPRAVIDKIYFKNAERFFCPFYYIYPYEKNVSGVWRAHCRQD